MTWSQRALHSIFISIWTLKRVTGQALMSMGGEIRSCQRVCQWWEHQFSQMAATRSSCRLQTSTGHKGKAEIGKHWKDFPKLWYWRKQTSDTTNWCTWEALLQARLEGGRIYQYDIRKSNSKSKTPKAGLRNECVHRSAKWTYQWNGNIIRMWFQRALEANDVANRHHVISATGAGFQPGDSQRRQNNSKRDQERCHERCYAHYPSLMTAHP